MNDEGRYLAVKVVMMPRDTNPYGTIFGGVLLSYADQAGAEGARHYMRMQTLAPKPLVTVAMNRVEFHEPVFVGDTVSFWTEVESVGKTSITMRVTVEAEREKVPRLLTNASVTYVAISTKGGQRLPIPIRDNESN